MSAALYAIISVIIVSLLAVLVAIPFLMKKKIMMMKNMTLNTMMKWSFNLRHLKAKTFK